MEIFNDSMNPYERIAELEAECQLHAEGNIKLQDERDKLRAENERLLQSIKAGGDVSKRQWKRIQELEAENQRLREAAGSAITERKIMPTVKPSKRLFVIGRLYAALDELAELLEEGNNG